MYHHPQEDLLLASWKFAILPRLSRSAASHSSTKRGAERLRRVAGAVDNVLADREIRRESVVNIIREFIEHERRHIMMEDCDLFPAALKSAEVPRLDGDGFGLDLS